MTSIHPQYVKEVEERPGHPDTVPGTTFKCLYWNCIITLVLHSDASHEHFINALDKLVDETDVTKGPGTPDVSKTIHTPTHTVPTHPWLGKYIPGFEALAAKYHVGNFVVDRDTGEKFFESMPICGNTSFPRDSLKD